MRTAVCSVISPNYRHYARVLMTSVQRHHPDWDRFVTIAGGKVEAGESEPFTPIAIEALHLPNLREMSFRYNVLELDTAIKPWTIEYLFDLGYDRVIYLDPDIVVYSPLAELEQPSLITLTPHLTRPVDDGAGYPRERSILIAGAWNLGFLALTRGADLQRFLEWWKGRLEYDCVVEPDRGLFVDQKWIDLVPGLFEDVRFLRHEGYNVAYWNLQQRRVTKEGAQFLVNGVPLRFFHFSGFQPALPKQISRHDPRSVAKAGDAAELFADYAAALKGAGFHTFRNAPYAFGHFINGVPITDAARAAYRRSPDLQAKADGDPFARPELFQNMVAPKPPLAARAKYHTYHVLSRARPAVELLPKKMRTSIREALLGPAAEPRALPEPRPIAPIQPEATRDLQPGVAIAGYISRDTGVGESARRCAESCDAAEIPSQLVDVDTRAPVRAARRATILHVNADMLPSVVSSLHPSLHPETYMIGVWHWELPDFPAAWASSASLLREIWAPSAFVAGSVAKSVTIPVVHMPHGVDVSAVTPFSPTTLGVAEGRFVFLFMFDFDSVIERKNPGAAIRAFRRAFPRDEGASLLIKTTGAARHRSALADLETMIEGDDNIHLADRVLPRTEVNGLIASCDAVVSLHRSEGFGLILAEAMALGKPVIATGWSGNVDFMSVGNSCLVGYELVPLERNFGPYPAGSHWAEPDVDHAAWLMSRIFRDAEYRAAIGHRASETIRTQFSPEAAGKRYRDRLIGLGLYP